MQESRTPARRRIRRPQPHEIGSVVPWGILSVAGDPSLLLVPFIELAGLLLAVLALGSSGQPEVVVPLVSIPPVDAYQDVGAIDLFVSGSVRTWILRLSFLAVRTLAFGALACLAVQRARGAVPDLRAAVATVRARIRALGAIELVSFAAFGSVLILRGPLTQGRSDPSVRAGLLVGALFLPTALIAAAADGLGAGRALRRSFLWVVRRPLGHLAVSLGAFAATGALERLAVAGGHGRAPALPTTLLAFATAFATAVAVAVLARRYELLYSDAAIARRRHPPPA
ncbi:MAG: hypothetical protein HY775_03000 [Acidobacteria bacterium]|nr:hypothetical protein [Acidobacteriota bacterium]